MAETRMFRPETRVYDVVSTVPASNSTYDFPMPAGAYHIALTTKSSVTGTTTTIAVAPLVGANGDQLNVSAYRMAEPDDTGPVALLTLPAGAAGRFATLVPAALVTTPMVMVTDGGVRVTVTKGGATTGELLEVQLICTRIA